VGLLINILKFSPQMILRGQIWRLVTFAIVPTNTGILAIIMFYFYYFIGNTLEQNWGVPKFNIYFFSGMILTIIYGFLIYFITGSDILISAEYIYLSMFFSFAALFPNTEVLFFFVIPMKIKWLAYIDAAFFVYEFIRMPFPYNFLPVVAVLNFLVFCGPTLFSSFRRTKKNNTVNFAKAAKKINKQQNRASYNRKCEVCGRTDTDYPSLEFRYCSKCTGYHCFCQDHINDHIHFTE